MDRVIAIGLGALALSMAGCGGGDDEPSGVPDNFEESDTEYTFVTYNAGLAVGFVPDAEGRLDDIGPALAELDVDVICLQEVWNDEQVAAIKAATSSAFPHQHWPEPSQSDDASCASGELDSLASCLDDAGCADECVDEVDDCLFDECGLPFLTLPSACMRCAMAGVGGDPDEILETCESDPVAYAYDGSFGTALISRHRISEVNDLVLESTTNRRGVISAQVELPQGDVTAYCTHLTAVFDTIPYPRDIGDWETEQADQIAALNVAVRNTPSARSVLMGDLNTGPAIGGFEAEAGDNWELVVEEDWSTPYLDLEDPPCTYCADNPLLAGSADDDDSRIIDHVLVRGFSEVLEADRILDGSLPGTESCGTDYGDGALSDHYGVAVTVEW